MTSRNTAVYSILHAYPLVAGWTVVSGTDPFVLAQTIRMFQLHACYRVDVSEFNGPRGTIRRNDHATIKAPTFPP